jgi:hypothetical protein
MLRGRGLSVLKCTVLRPARLPPLPAPPQEREQAHNATTSAAVPIAFSVATGSRTFQPKLISWS